MVVPKHLKTKPVYFNPYAKSVIENMTCSIHHQSPTINIEDSLITLDCCCSTFKVECLREIFTLIVVHKNKTLQIKVNTQE